MSLRELAVGEAGTNERRLDMSEQENEYRLTARQKVRLYLITLFTCALVYVIPHIPREVWQFALWIPLVAIGGGLLVGALTIFLALKTGQKFIHAKFGGCREFSKGKKGRVVVGRWSNEEEEEPAGGGS